MGSKLRFQYNLNAEEETGGQKLIKLLEASLQLMFFCSLRAVLCIPRRVRYPAGSPYTSSFKHIR